jgi:hypothetical protein
MEANGMASEKMTAESRTQGCEVTGLVTDGKE